MKSIIKTGLLLCSFACCGTAFSQEEKQELKKRPVMLYEKSKPASGTEKKPVHSKTRPLTRAEAVPNKQKF